jgi:mono/diheme cytochrome c family protein
MKTTRSLLALALLTGCAAPEQQQSPQVVRPIEPPAKKARGPAIEGGDEFVLSRAGNGGARSAEPGDVPLHVGEEWWRHRGEFLQVGAAQAKERDAAISDKQPPPVFWDEQTASEAAAVWGTLCNECHGGRRRVMDAVKMPPPPAGWGRGQGLFFGARRGYDVLFNVVYNGGPERNGKKSPMPAWRGRLAREQVWAILYFLEYQSGGIEGRFPPSLYPRQSAEGQ